MASPNREKAIALVNLLVDKGKLPNQRGPKNEAFRVIMEGLKTKVGVEAKVREKAESWITYRSVIAVLVVAFRELPDKEKPKSISEELEGEARDYEDALEVKAMVSEQVRGEINFTEPSEELIVRRPSILETTAYQGHERLYAENTYISVRREAEAEHTSMHEICRRKGLTYELLIQ